MFQLPNLMFQCSSTPVHQETPTQSQADPSSAPPSSLAHQATGVILGLMLMLLFAAEAVSFCFFVVVFCCSIFCCMTTILCYFLLFLLCNFCCRFRVQLPLFTIDVI